MGNDAISVTEFRANIYAMIDEIGKTGEPKLLLRNDELFEIRKKPKRVAKNKKKVLNDLSKIKPLDIMVEEPDWYISPKLHEWSGEVDPNLS